MVLIFSLLPNKLDLSSTTQTNCFYSRLSSHGVIAYEPHSHHRYIRDMNNTQKGECSNAIKLYSNS